jgi:hypothetical protein
LNYIEGESNRYSWKISDAYGPARGQKAPLCQKCGKHVRSDESPRTSFRQNSLCNLPWNAGWDGRCEACSFQFEAVALDSMFHKKRRAIFRPINQFSRHIDIGASHAGIEVEIIETDISVKPSDQKEQKTRYFLSMNEVQTLLQALQGGSLEICFEQWDWSEDWT